MCRQPYPCLCRRNHTQPGGKLPFPDSLLCVTKDLTLVLLYDTRVSVNRGEITPLHTHSLQFTRYVSIAIHSGHCLSSTTTPPQLCTQFAHPEVLSHVLFFSVPSFLPSLHVMRPLQSILSYISHTKLCCTPLFRPEQVSCTSE
jgi:hypothetical protein